MGWVYEGNNGRKWDGEFEGEVKDGQPNGVGRWSAKGGKWKVEGLWKEGKVHGKATTFYSSGRVEEYEKKDGKLDGNLLVYHGRGHEESEYRDGKLDGRQRKYNGFGEVVLDSVFEEGKMMRRIK